MKGKTNFIIGKFNDTGINTVDTDLVIKKWNKTWAIAQWAAKFTLVKSVRQNSVMVGIKTEISGEQANELITKLGLQPLKSGLFRRAFTWKKED